MLNRSTITAAQKGKITKLLNGMQDISEGVGDAGSACSIAAINLALSGELTDEIPGCMSPVIGRWIISVQDNMPSEMRNSKEWRKLLPLAAGTGREHEAERLATIHAWMWETVLPTLLPLAAEYGFATKWQTMLDEKTAAAAHAAAAAADAYYASRAAYDAASAARYAADNAAATSAAPAAYDAASAADNAAATYAARVASDAANAARAAKGANAAYSAACAARAAANAAAWETFSPVKLLEVLCN